MRHCSHGYMVEKFGLLKRLIDSIACVSLINLYMASVRAFMKQY